MYNKKSYLGSVFISHEDEDLHVMYVVCVCTLKKTEEIQNQYLYTHMYD